jgi:DNA-binding response OmpR family regulator
MIAPRQAPTTVLIADDDTDLREILVEFLQAEADWEVIEAHDGAHALNEILTRQPDVAVVDYRMPKLNGVEVVAGLRQAGLATPIILVTAAADVQALARQAGVKCYLGKPFEFDELVSLLHCALAGSC